VTAYNQVERARLPASIGQANNLEATTPNHPSPPSLLRAVLGLALALSVVAASPAQCDSFSQSALPAPGGHINHAPGIIELPSGRLLACWYSGTTEAGEDTSILCSDSMDGGATWEIPTRAAEPGERAIGAVEANKSLGNVALYLDTAGRLWMIHGVIQRWTIPLIGNLCRNWVCGRVDTQMSVDEGVSWLPAVRFDDQSGALPRAKPLHHPTLGDLVPLYREASRTAYVRVLDFAALWPRERPASRILEIPGDNVIQPSLVLRPDGKVRAYLRDSNHTAVRTALLDPTTATWSAAEPTDLPNPDSGLDAFIDDTGEIVVIHNPSTTNRHALMLSASADGVHFTRHCNLVAARTQGDVAYPAVIRGSDGLWHIAYSAHGKTEIRHISFDSAWLRRCLGR